MNPQRKAAALSAVIGASVEALSGLCFVTHSLIWIPIGAVGGGLIGLIVGLRIEWSGTPNATAFDQTACQIGGCLLQAMLMGCWGCVMTALTFLGGIVLALTMIIR